jgi:predicted dithiol-disulfide oxidoreductase (DUF899 family)
MSTSTIAKPKIVSRREWLAHRKKLLAREKRLTHERDAVAAERRHLPWVRVEKDYVFDAPGGRKTLADLFQGKSQLVVYHFMFAPDWEEGCPSCSFVMDHTDPTLAHLAQRDVAFAAVSRAPIAKLEPFRKRMGWRFPWVSSFANDFNWDYGVSFEEKDLDRDDIYNFGTIGHPSVEAPGFSIFARRGKDVFHTYSSYGRGVEVGMHTYNLLDLVPKGRDEEHLDFTMEWVRHHDRYEDGTLADPDRPYWPAEGDAQGKEAGASRASRPGALGGRRRGGVRGVKKPAKAPPRRGRG